MRIIHIMSFIIAVVAVINHQINHISTAWDSDFFRKPQKRLQPTTLIIAAEVFVGIENYSSGNGNAT